MASLVYLTHRPHTLKKYIYFRERQQESKQGREEERGRERNSSRISSSAWARAQSPTPGSISLPWDQDMGGNRVWCPSQLSDPGAPRTDTFIKHYFLHNKIIFSKNHERNEWYIMQKNVKSKHLLSLKFIYIKPCL